MSGLEDHGNQVEDSSPRLADESSVSSCGSEMSELRRVSGTPSRGNGERPARTVTELLEETLRNQHLLMEDFESMQQEQRGLKERLDCLQREQEKFHIGGYKRMEQGFKKVDKCLGQMEGINEVFKEVIGIISGQRIRFVDHSQESLNEQDAHLATTSELLEDNGRRNVAVWNDSMSYNRDRRILEGTVKREVQNPWALTPENAAPRTDTAVPQATEAPEMEHPLDIDNPTSVVASGPPQLSETAAVGNGFVQRYRMNRAIKTVTDLAREYYEGLPGQPSVMALERRFGSTWRSSAGERTFFHKRYVIIQRIETILREPARFNLPLDITRRKAVRVVENIRIGNNKYNNGTPCYMTLAQLYLYFSKYLDSYEDYSLTLKNKDAPSIREIKSRQKKSASSSQLSEEHRIMT